MLITAMSGLKVEEIAGKGEERQQVGDRHGNGLAHEFTGIGHLGEQRGHHHARRGLAEKRHGQGEDVGIELLAQVGQGLLADDVLQGVDGHFETRG